MKDTEPTYNRIKEVRKSLNMTQTEFAAATGKTRDSISNLELGRVAPDKTFVELVCRKFGVDEIWLRTGEGQPFSDTPDEDEIVAALSQAMGGNPSTAKMRLIRAIAKMPEAYFPAIEQMITALAAELPPPPKN